MGKQTRGYRVWDPASEDALKAGVRKHGLGAWEHIRKDPQFAILSDRTGVQLKDKWRNLVKFRHIDPDEQRTYKPKTQGPWSKKYKRERTQALSGTASPTSGDGGASEDEAAQNADPQAMPACQQANGEGPESSQLVLQQQQLILQAQRQSGRTNAQKRKAITDLALLLEGDGQEPHTASEGEEHAGAGPSGGGAEGDSGLKRGRPRSVARGPVGRGSSSRQRKAHEDRRFGIYDRRRYGFAEDGTAILGRSCDGYGSGAASESDGGGCGRGTALPRVRRRVGGGAAGRRGASRGGSEDDENEEDVEDHVSGSDAEVAMDDAIQRSGGGCGGQGRCGGAVEEYVISCPCGVTYDDGEMMIECESCAAWAHVACLRRQMATQPERYHYNFDTYHCSGCQAALHALQHGSGGFGGGGNGSLQGHGGGGGYDSSEAAAAAAAGGGGFGPGPGRARGRTRLPSMVPVHPGGGRNGAQHLGGGHGRLRTEAEQERQEPQDPDGDGDTASEDSQRKASELSNILLGLANGRLGSGGSISAGGGGGLRRGGSCGGGSFSKLGPLGRTSGPSAGHRSGGGGAAAANGGSAAAGGGSSPVARTGSMGHTSSSGGLGGAAAGAVASAAGGDQAVSFARDSNGRDGRLQRSYGQPHGGADGLRRAGGCGGGPANSTGSRGVRDGAGSPPPLRDGGIPLFQGAGAGPGGGGASCGGGTSGGPKIFKPVPKLAMAGGLPGGSQPPTQPQQQQLSAPKARPHPALQRGASQHSLQRMLESANPLAATAAAGGGSSAPGGRGLPLSSVLEAAGPLQVAAANLCAATGGRKAATAAAVASASAGGATAASDGVGSSDAAAGVAGAGALPPRPPSRPPSSMAREVWNRIFGEDDDDDAGGMGRPLSALRGVDPWFLVPPSLSRATTPSSAFLDTFLRATPDILPLPGSSPPPHLAAALAAVRSVSPGAAYLPAFLAQQQQQQAAMQQFMSQSAAQPQAAASTAALQTGGAAATAAVAAAGILRPQPLGPPLPFVPPPVTLGGGAASSWPGGAPPPPLSLPLPPPPSGPLHQASDTGEPVALHPVLRHLLFTTAQQQQQQQQQAQQQAQQQRSAECSGASQQQQPGVIATDGGDAGVTTGNEEPGEAARLPKPPQQQHLLPHHAQQSQQQPSQEASARGGVTAPAADRASCGGAASAVGLVVQPLGRASATPPLPTVGSVAGSSAMADALRDVAMAAAAAAAVAGNGTGGAGAPPAGMDSNSSSMAALLGMGGLNLNVLDHLRSSSPDPWGGLFRTSTPGPEAILQTFLGPSPGDLASLAWLKSATPPLPGAFSEALGHPPAAGTDLSSVDR